MLVASLAHDASATCGPGGTVMYTVDLKRRKVAEDAIDPPVARPRPPNAMCGAGSPKVTRSRLVSGSAIFEEQAGKAWKLVASVPDVSGVEITHVRLDHFALLVTHEGDAKTMFAIDLDQQKVVWRRPITHVGTMDWSGCRELGAGRISLATSEKTLSLVELATGAAILPDIELEMDFWGASVTAAGKDRFVFRGRKEIVVVDAAAKRVLWRRSVPLKSGDPIVVGDRVAFGLFDSRASKVGVRSWSLVSGKKLADVMGPIGRAHLWQDPPELAVIDNTHLSLAATYEVCIAP